MSDRIAIIDSGELQQIDAPLTCYDEPTNLFVAGFIGSPSMNLIDGEVTESGFTSEYFDIEFDPANTDTQVGQQVTIGVRPEDIYPAETGRTLSHPTAEITGRADVLEPMGDEIFIYMMLSEEETADLDDPDAGGQLLISVPPDSDIAEDQNVPMVLDRSKLHLFDTETGNAIEHSLVEPTAAGDTAGGEAQTDD